MSAPFVTQLRARPASIRLGDAGLKPLAPGAGRVGPAVTIRVEMPEVWDTVRVVASPDETVLAVKTAALEALFPAAEYHADFVLKFRGWEILEEAASLDQVGVGDGAILLLTHRRRRPVR